MKQLLSFLLVLSLITPSLALAVPFDEVIPPTSAPRPGTGSTQDVLAGTGPNAAARIAAISQSGNVIGCQTGGRGGALGGQFSQFVQNLVPNLLRNALGRAASSLAENAGPFGGLIMQGADLLAGYLGKQVNSLIQPILDGPVGQAINGIFGGQAGGIVNSLLNGAGVGQIANQVLGGVVGGALGAGAIPVNTVSINELIALIRQFTEDTKHATELHVQKKCVGDVATKQAAKAQAAQIVSEYLQYSQEHLIQNIPAHIKAGTEAVAKDVIENKLPGLCAEYEPDIKALLLTRFESGVDVGAQSACDLPETGGPESNELESFWNAGFSLNGSSIGQFISADDSLNSQLKEYAHYETVSIIANGQFVGDIECLREGETPVGGTCPGGHRVVTPGSVGTFITNKAIDQGREEATQADEVQELPTQLIAALSSMVLQGLSGIAGVVESSGSGSEGSYLDQAVAEASYGSDTAVHSAIGSDIAAALETEVEYRDVVRLAIRTVADIRTSYTNAIACLRPKASSGSATALTRMNAASTTVATILTPEIVALTNLETDVNEAVEELTDLVERLARAQTADEAVYINEQYLALVDSGVVHTATDLAQLTSNFEAAINTLNLFTIEAAALLAECQTL